MKVTPAELWLRHPFYFFGFGLGSGLAPKAPGTFGSLAALLLYLVCLQFLPTMYFVAMVFAAALVGPLICGRTSDAMGVHDHGAIVWDEFVGLWITLIMAPQGWIWVLFGFALFRLFDIWKPFPIGWLDQRVHGGWGIMIDDVLAGFYGLMILQAAHYTYIGGFFE